MRRFTWDFVLLQHITLRQIDFPGRYRNCTRKHAGSGKSCESIGSRVEIKKCILRKCPVDGQPGQWQQWSDCEIDCQDSTRVRFRKCDKPSPKHFGFPCFDKMKETEQCPSTKPCPIDSKFSEWSSWGECSVTCGTGIKKRTQPCIESEYGGKPCLEKEKIETEICETNTECPALLNEISTDIVSVNETQAAVDNKQGGSISQQSQR